MTFTKDVPTVPGFYAWRRAEYERPVALNVGWQEDAEHEPVKFLVTLDADGGESYLPSVGEWCRLVPADEVEKASPRLVRSTGRTTSSRP